MPQASWLFVKDQQSIWIERVDDKTMVVAGPGTARDQRVFPDEDAVQAFQIGLSERLTEAGWFLWGFDRDRREGSERRSVSRPAKDRRQGGKRG